MIEDTLVIIKPDAVKRGIVGDIIKRFERAGLKIVGMKMLKFDKELAEKFYEFSEEWYLKVGQNLLKKAEELGIDIEKRYGTRDPKEIGKIVRNLIIEYITSGPVVAMVLEGINATKIVRKLVGPTDPRDAPPGTIRGDFSHTNRDYANLKMIAVRNVVHASEDPESARKEIGLIFSEDEIYRYRRNIEEVIY